MEAEGFLLRNCWVQSHILPSVSFCCWNHFSSIPDFTGMRIVLIGYNVLFEHFYTVQQSGLLLPLTSSTCTSMLFSLTWAPVYEIHHGIDHTLKLCCRNTFANKAMRSCAALNLPEEFMGSEHSWTNSSTLAWAGGVSWSSPPGTMSGAASGPRMCCNTDTPTVFQSFTTEAKQKEPSEH